MTNLEKSFVELNAALEKARTYKPSEERIAKLILADATQILEELSNRKGGAYSVQVQIFKDVIDTIEE